MRWLYRYFLILTFSSSIAFSQQDKQLDSLQILYSQAKVDTQKYWLLTDMGVHMQRIGNYTEAVSYYQKAVEGFSKKNPLRAIDCKNRIAFQYIFLEKYDKVDSILKETGAASEKINYQKGMGHVYRYRGCVCMYTGDYKKATVWFLKAQASWEKTGNLKWIALGYSDLGNNFYSQQNKEKAAYYYENCLRISPDTSSLDYINDGNNLASAYLDLNKLDKAEPLLKKTLAYYSNKKEQIGYTNSLGALASLEDRRKNYAKALAYELESIKIKEGINSSNATLVQNYLDAGTLNMKLNKPKEAIEFAEKGYEKAKLSEQKPALLRAYNSINWIYGKAGNYEKAYEFSILYNELKDSLNDIENQKQINELDKQYQTEKKEKENQLLNKKVELQHIQGKQQKLYLIISAVIVVFVCFLAIVLFRQNAQKQKTNLKLESKNKIIEEQHKDIIDSINYAKRIQQAVLSEEEHISEHLPPHFILFKPKDIVSGDFYWALEKSDYLYVAAADCTGHGVPGAFLTMLGISYLNEINSKEEIFTPAEILNQLRDKIVKELSRHGTTKDGMDISLMRMNLKNTEIMWAGAFNPLWYTENGVLKEIKANKQPIGYAEDLKPFTNHTLPNLRVNDSLYLFTDGFADQFGGVKGKKFKYKQLQQVLLSVQHETMQKQEEILTATFNNWKGSLEQVDDVLVIGVRV